MSGYLIIIGLCIVLGLLYYFAFPVLFFIGKYILKGLTFNKYPPPDPTSTQKKITADTAVAFFVLIIIIIFFIRNN